VVSPLVAADREARWRSGMTIGSTAGMPAAGYSPLLWTNIAGARDDLSI